MPSLRLLALLFVCVVPLACHSGTKRHEVPCTCGQPEADMQGCAHHACLQGERNPDNPDCVCGSLTIPK